MKIPTYNAKTPKDKDGKELPVETNQEITQNLIEYAVNTKYQKEEGSGSAAHKVPTLSGSQGRMFGRIQRKLDDVAEKNLDEVSFETAEVEFIKGAVDACAFPPAHFRHVVLLVQALDEEKV